MAGYSGTPLLEKLGVKPASRLAILNAPDELPPELLDPPDDVAVARTLRGTKPFDVILLYCRNTAALQRGFAKAAQRLTQAGGLWVCWPKKSSGIKTDIHDAIVREHGLTTGLVDNKVCAIDDTWSGLRFVVRVQDRT